MQNINDYTFFISSYTCLINPSFHKSFRDFSSPIFLGESLAQIELQDDFIPKNNTLFFQYKMINNNVFSYRKNIVLFNKIFVKDTQSYIILQGIPKNLNEDTKNNNVFCIFSLKDIEQYFSKKINKDNSFNITTMLMFVLCNITFIQNKEDFKKFFHALKVFRKLALPL